MATAESSQGSKLLQPLRTVCILGGSKFVNVPHNIYVVSQLVKELGKHNINILYGGTSIYFFNNLLMAAKCFDIQVRSILPFYLTSSKVVKDSATLMITLSIYDCLMSMISGCDAFIILPGGYGTLMTTFTLATWAEMKFHTKPIGAAAAEDGSSLLIVASSSGKVTGSQAGVLLAVGEELAFGRGDAARIGRGAAVVTTWNYRMDSCGLGKCSYETLDMRTMEEKYILMSRHEKSWPDMRCFKCPKIFMIILHVLKNLSCGLSKNKNWNGDKA
ncbi:cytokinin riboside 5'-monophosphatephosphoribohydrolase LOG [Striga asiatica]|uniref:cytokinin riboside 5'-monophosphate phosphoribohydrolase n=1 Tax=Striga asiatica TaxID=4170 RepID=A0A5A7QCL6_STRAF|nr:cytokinin riboside 5'-monophosphatephosphoribohydrolase LOG [Striga asiatica]